LNAHLPKLSPLTLPNIKDGFSLVEKLEIFENLLQNHWTLLPRFNIIVPVVSGKRLKCKSLRTTGRDGHQVMIIPRITLKGLIFIQAHPYQYMKKHNKN
jgi:hypothetical protein